MVMALDGIKVIDLSRLAPGPFCSMYLADFGADVLMIEAVPGASDKVGSRMGGGDAERAAAYNAVARGKRSIALNLKEESARKILHDLVKDADVVLEGFRPGVVKRLGADYETLSKINPRIVYCSLSGFGQTGPYSNLVGHDINYISIGGALGQIGYTPHGKPAIPTNMIADFAGGGLTAALGICLALLAREKTGRGQAVDIGMSDGVMTLMASAMSGYFQTGAVMRPGESTLTGSVPWYGPYQTKDNRWFSIGSIEPHFYANLCELLNVPEYADKQHDASVYPEMRAKFEEIFKTKTADEWFEHLSQKDVCATPVLEMDRLATDPHQLARKMVVEVDSPVGKVKQVGVGIKLSDTPGQVRFTGPMPGQHTDDVLSSMGYDAAKIAELKSGGAVA